MCSCKRCVVFKFEILNRRHRYVCVLRDSHHKWFERKFALLSCELWGRCYNLSLLMGIPESGQFQRRYSFKQYTLSVRISLMFIASKYLCNTVHNNEDTTCSFFTCRTCREFETSTRVPCTPNCRGVNSRFINIT